MNISFKLVIIPYCMVERGIIGRWTWWFGPFGSGSLGRLGYKNFGGFRFGNSSGLGRLDRGIFQGLGGFGIGFRG